MEKRRYILLGLICAFQAGLFLLLKLYFFEKFNEDAKIGNDTKPTNSTLLLY